MSTPTRARGKMNNAFDPEPSTIWTPATQELVRARSERLGPAYRLFYNDPVHIVRGEGSRLWDAEGNEYLDAYNNVVCVGHAHPHVVAAVAGRCARCARTRAICTTASSRYAGELLETFGGRGRRGPRDVHLHGLGGQRPRAAHRQVPHGSPRRRHHRRGLPRQLRADGRDLAVAGRELPARSLGPPGGRPRLLPRRAGAARAATRRRRAGADPRPRTSRRRGRGVHRRLGVLLRRHLHRPRRARPGRRRRCARPAACSSPTRCSPASAGSATACGATTAMPSTPTSSRSASRWATASPSPASPSGARSSPTSATTSATSTRSAATPSPIAAAQATLDVIRDEGLVANSRDVGAALLPGLAEIQQRHPGAHRRRPRQRPVRSASRSSRIPGRRRPTALARRPWSTRCAGGAS